MFDIRSKASPVSAIAAIGGLVLATAAHAQSISPNSVEKTISIGETFTINKSITLGASGATNVDVMVLADNTGSMGSTIGKAEAGASAILNALPSSYKFGVSRYFGDPAEGVSPSAAYEQLTSLTSSKANVQSGINSWVASGGGDYPEGNYFALKQTADTAAWRPEAQRIVVWFGDAPAHTETTTKAEAISALAAANAKVVAFNNTSAGSGIDGSYTGEAIGTRQASDIVSAVGGSVTNNFLSVSDTDFVSAVTKQISTAASSVDLAFSSTFSGSGLKLKFTCTDILGCDGVKGGETRKFDFSVTGLLAGDYSFKVFAQGIDAFETDTIHVVTAPVPEPSTYLMMLAGLIGIVTLKKKRNAKA